MCYLNVSAAEINFHGWGWEQRPLIWCEQRPLIWGGWLEKVRIRLTSASTGVGVEVEAELGN